MEISKTPIPLDDEETIRRFTEEIRRRSVSYPAQHQRIQASSQPFNSLYTDGRGTDKGDKVRDKSTQTEPVTIMIDFYPNGQKVSEPKGSAAGNFPVDQAKLRSPALEAVLAQSPQVSGVLAPPPTPENIPNYEISQMISDAIDDLPPGVFSSLGDSRFAPQRSLPPKTPTGNKSSSTPKEYISSGLSQQTSPGSRRAREESYSRMSFKAAESVPVSAPNKISESVFVNDIESSIWAKRLEGFKWDIGPVSSARLFGTNEKVNTVTETPGNAQSDPDGAKGLGSVGQKVAEATFVPPHLRANENESNRPVSTSTEFAKVADNSKISELPQAMDKLKVAQVESSDQAVNIEKEASGPLPLSSDLESTSASYPSSSRVPPSIDLSKENSKLFPSTRTEPTFKIEDTICYSVSPLAHNSAALTPSSAEINTPSPPRGESGLAKNKNPEGALYFKAWPKLEERSTSKVRKVIITGISSPTPRLIASLVFGGALDQFYIRDKSAVVVFLHATDCQTYYDATPNGVVYKRDGKECSAFVEMGDEVDVISGQLASYIEKGFTRCVRVIGVDPKIPLNKLWAKAEDKNRRVEWVEDENNEAGHRSVVFRFCDIRHAVTFKLATERDIPWERCSFHFSPDPCENATAPHFDLTDTLRGSKA